MRGTSKVIMGATLVMVVSLAIVLGLILVLLAELYCSLLLRRRQLRNTTSDTPTAAVMTSTTATNPTSSQPSHSKDESPPSPHSSFYAQGVLQAPRSLLFPAVSGIEDEAETKKLTHHIIDVQTQESNASPRQIGLLSASSPPTPCNDKASGCGEHFVYISNPIYDNDAMPSGVDSTPFETPDTSPSRLDTGGSSGDDDEVPQPSSPTTPPLTPMKKLPAEACSVSLRNARSFGTSGSDSNSGNGRSSSSSGSPCTSPSW
ncbi:cell wall protein RBT1 [Alnus glutinosa]|uniref:cell wall protein RBT1 n=1 Tax=Alnus glutinosa TaxID=3517 RepID=UPI002D765F6F|nr:cell wall protein RBT1 [Alnus glutinosa]